MVQGMSYHQTCQGPKNDSLMAGMAYGKFLMKGK